MWAGLKRARDQSQRFMTKPTHYILLPRDDMLTIISKKSRYYNKTYNSQKSFCRKSCKLAWDHRTVILLSGNGKFYTVRKDLEN